MKNEEYNSNIKKLLDWSNSYYNLDEPKASDEEYDKLARAVKEYETKTGNIHPASPNINVGSSSLNVNKGKHINKLYSLQDIMNKNELVNWLSKLDSYKGKYVTEPKYDGVSLNLIYKQGILKQAITRGNGLIGEVVTRNAKYIDGIITVLSESIDIEIRGEVCISKKDFDNINNKRLKEGLDTFANPRNAASGSLRLLDKDEVKNRSLVFIPWGIGEYSAYDTLDDLSNRLDSLGYDYSINIVDKENIHKSCMQILEGRDNFNLPIDGVVIKMNDCTQYPVYGYTSKFPKYSCAYKFPPVEKTTKLYDVKCQIGRTGRITPVGILEPIDIDGSTVSRVTLHNYNEINIKDIRLGDEILLVKSGDIIPKITKVFTDRRDDKVTIIDIPVNCPECNNEISLVENGVPYCTNLSCIGIKLAKLIHFVSKECMNIEDLNEKTLRLFMEKKLVNNYKDIFSLKYDDINALDGHSSLKTENILNSINKAKDEADILKVIRCLSINNVGKFFTGKLQKYKNDKSIFDLTYDELVELNGLGEKTVNNFISYINENKRDIEELIDILEITPIIKNNTVQSPYTDMNVVLTGGFHVSRNILTDKLKELGASISNNITKNTDILFVGDKPTTSKINKANKLGVKIKDTINI